MASSSGDSGGSERVGHQIAPGLLSLSRPISQEDSAANGNGDNKKGKKKKKAVEGTAAVAISTSKGGAEAGKRKGKSSAVDDLKANEQQLSQSAPDARSSPSTWDMPSAVNQAGPSAQHGLTWQQQLLNAKPAGEKRKTEKTNGGKKDKATKVKNGSQTPSGNSSLTWQQELFDSKKDRGPAYDVFADARDAMTFGGGANQQGNHKKKGNATHRQRADSAGDVDLRHATQATRAGKGKSSQGPSSVAGSQNGQQPSTPNKLAYAGPNFHNSPSPASLPVPKFLQTKQAPGGVAMSASTSATNVSTVFAREAAAQAREQELGTNHPETISSPPAQAPAPPPPMVQQIPPYQPPPPIPPAVYGHAPHMVMHGFPHPPPFDPNSSFSSMTSSDDDPNRSYGGFDPRLPPPRHFQPGPMPMHMPMPPMPPMPMQGPPAHWSPYQSHQPPMPPQSIAAMSPQAPVSTPTPVASTSADTGTMTIENLLAKMMRPSSG